MKKVFAALLVSVLLTGCASYDYPGEVKIGAAMPGATGESLDGQVISIPKDFIGQPTLLLLGYVHKSQFDIDRWLIGLDMTQTDIRVFEIPAIKNVFARLVSNNIDNSMREGIPSELWADVITVYADGDKLQRFTGNVKPKNARVLLLDGQGKVVHFYDRGFSVAALNALREKIG
ncbi:MAG: hypothetical protein Alis3KO_10730 [Aliiglaciecola sp.]